MPYFQREPIEGLKDLVGSGTSYPGLPSRGGAVADVPTQSVTSEEATTGIVEQADAVLASTRPFGGTFVDVGPDSAASELSSHIAKLQAPASGLVEPPAAIAGPGLEAPQPTLASPPALVSHQKSSDLIIEPAPVLTPPGPVPPGETAQTTISLINEDRRAAQILFSNTALIGENGGDIPAACVSFQPSELTIEAGEAGDVVVCVDVPPQTPCGIYSGLIRASRLEHLHAVLVVQVERP